MYYDRTFGRPRRRAGWPWVGEGPARGHMPRYDAPEFTRTRGGRRPADRAARYGRGYDVPIRELPSDFPPRHWGGVGPRDTGYDRGYRGRGYPGPGGFFRGGF